LFSNKLWLPAIIYHNGFWPDYEQHFTLRAGESLVFENELAYIRASKAVYTGIPGVEVCLIGDVDEDGYDEDDLVIDCQIADEEGDAFFGDLDEGWYVVVVNAGLEFDFNPAFQTFVGEPEFFEWGHAYENTPIVDPLGVGGLFKEFYVGEWLGETDWDNIAGSVQIFCDTPVPVAAGTCDPEGDDLYAIINADELFPTEEDTYGLLLNSVFVGDYTLCWQFELTVDDAITIGALNEVQSADVVGIVAGVGAITSIDFGVDGVTGAVDWVDTGDPVADDPVNTAAVQAAIDAVATLTGNVTATVSGTVITFTFTGALAGMDIPYLVEVNYTDAVGAVVAIATEDVVGSPEALEDYTVFWFGCEEFTVEEGITTELFNDIDFDGVVVGDIIVSLDTTVAGETYEVCLQYGILFELVLDCDDAVVGNGASVLVIMEPDILALFNAFLEDEVGFQVPTVFRARAVNQTSDAVTLSLPTEVDVLTDPPPHIFLEAPL
jgi:hypothetical protein